MYVYSKNISSLPNALWFIYILYATSDTRNFKEAIKQYNKSLTNPFDFIGHTLEETEGMMFIERYLNG